MSQRRFGQAGSASSADMGTSQIHRRSHQGAWITSLLTVALLRPAATAYASNFALIAGESRDFE
jgi:hypothetical protein